MHLDHRWWLLSVCVLCTLSASARAEEFVELLRLSGQHPAILASQASADAAMYDVEQAKATNSVKVTAGVASIGYSGYSEQMGYENSPFAPRIGASKVIYDHGRVDALVDGRQAAYQVRQEQVEVTRENVNRLILQYYTIAVSDAKVGAVLDQQIKELSTLRDKVRRIAAVDSGRAFEVSQVETRLNSAIASRVARETSQQQAWKQVTQLLQADVSLTHGLPELKGPGVLPATLAAAENEVDDNPQFIAAQYQRTEAEAAVRVASKWNRPQWTLQLNADSPRRNGNTHILQAATFQLVVQTDLFDGGSGRAALSGETMRLAAADREIEATRQALLQELRQLWVSLPLRLQQIDALAAQIKVAKQTRDAGEIQFLAGRRPLTDLISFVSDYYAGLASYEDQRVQYAATQWQILSALGRLTRTANEHPSLSAPRLDASPRGAFAVAGATASRGPGKTEPPPSIIVPGKYAPRLVEPSRQDNVPPSDGPVVRQDVVRSSTSQAEASRPLRSAGPSVPPNPQPKTESRETPVVAQSATLKPAPPARHAQPLQDQRPDAQQTQPLTQSPQRSDTASKPPASTAKPRGKVRPVKQATTPMQATPDAENELRKWPWK